MTHERCTPESHGVTRRAREPRRPRSRWLARASRGVSGEEVQVARAVTDVDRPRERGDRGRSADRPSEIPARGWRDVLRRVWGESSRDNVDIVAAGVAFYAFLAIPPLLAAVVSIYGLVVDPARVSQQLEELSQVLPEQAREVVGDQLRQVAASSGTALGLSFALSLALSLWGSMKATKALMTACNVAYDEEEGRGFVRQNALALMLTLGTILFLGASLVLVAVLPVVVDKLGLGGAARAALEVGRWGVLALLVLGALSLLYRFAPSRRGARWRWITWGSALATGVWIGASALFSLYVSNFGSYDETYGSLGAIVVLLFWLYLTGYAVMLGAELNAELEHQTARDTTRGPERPMGERDAYVADTLGR